MGKSSKAPAAPDPYESAKADADFNRLDVYGPSGVQQQFGYSSKGKFIPGSQPKGEQGAVRMVESPFDAWMRKQGEGVSRSLATQAGSTAARLGSGAAAPSAANFRGVPLPNAPTDSGLPPAATADAALRARIESTLFDRGASLMRPEVERQDRGLQNRLQAQGIPLGSEAFNDTYGSFTNNVNDAWGRLAMDSIIGGGQEMERDYGLKADARARAQGEQDRSYNYGVDVRGRKISDAAQFYDFANNARGRDFSELAAVLGGAYTPAPTVGGPQGANRIDMQGAINNQYQGQLAQWQAKNQSNAGLWGGLTSLGGAAIIASSRALKTDLGEIEGDVALGWVERMPVHAWRYKAGTPMRDDQVHIGPMAEDFHEITDAGVDGAIFATDPAGVAIAAVKGLLARVRALEAMVAHKEAA